MNNLTRMEQDRRAELETRVKRGLANFVEVGNALREIQDGRLYRNTHKTFVSYCVDVFGLGNSQADRIIQAARTAHNLSPTGDVDCSERALRPLARLSPVTQKVAYSAAMEATGGQPTEEATQAALDSILEAAMDDLPEADQQVLLERKQRSDLQKESKKQDAAARDRHLQKFERYVQRARREAGALVKFNLPGQAHLEEMVDCCDRALRELEKAQAAILSSGKSRSPDRRKRKACAV